MIYLACVSLVESCILPSRYTKQLRMKVGVAAHCECSHDLNFTILPDEFRHDSMQVYFYK